MIKIDYTPMQSFRYNQISNYQFELAMLNESNQILHTPTPCKDYLQDIIYCEYHQTSSEIFGMVWKPGTLDISAQVFKLVLMGGKVEMQSKISAIQEFMNYFDEAQGFPLTEIEETENPLHIVVKFSREWIANGPLLSAFTSLLRIGGTYQPGEGPENYLRRLMKESELSEKPFPKYMEKEVKRLFEYFPKIMALLAGKKVEDSWDVKYSEGMYGVHNKGILGFKDFPTVEV